jgi:alpha-1,6-mannosyltransferase
LCQLGHEHTVIAPGPCDEEAVDCRRVSAASRQRQRELADPDEGCATRRVVRIAGPALPYDRTYHLLGRFDKIRAQVTAREPDILEAHSPYLATLAVVACGRRAATVRTAFWHADHVGAYVQPALERALGPRAASMFGDALWRGVRVVLAPFDATFVAGRGQAERLRGAGVPNVVEAPFGVDRAFHPGARSDSLRRQLLGDAGEGTALLVGVGRFAIEKRWDVVLDAFEQVRGRRAAVLVLYGDGPDRKRLERRASAGVRFLGFEQDRERLGQALASADVLVHGCPYETFGLSVAEAVACGLPVVVPDAGGAAESANPASSEAYRRLDATACAAAIERLLARDRALEAARLAPTVEHHFETVVATYRALLKERGRR